VDDYLIIHIERKGPPASGSSLLLGHFSLENQHATRHDATESDKAKRSSGPDSPAMIIHRPMPSGQTSDESGLDEAQKIWLQHAEAFKTKHELDQSAAELTEENEEIKETK